MYREIDHGHTFIYNSFKEVNKPNKGGEEHLQ